MYCSAISMEVNEEVITVLSSVTGNLSVRVLRWVSSLPSQVTARNSTPRCRRNSATCKTSEVCPEREIRTGKMAASSFGNTNPGNRSISEAGTARTGTAAKTVNVAAAACAR